jgi:mxaK protein
MGLISSHRTRAVWASLAVLAAAAAVDTARTWRLQALNEQIRAGQPTAPSPNAAPELQFAHAHALAARGDFDQALKRYQALEAQTPLGQAARFNSANLLVRQALRAREGPQSGQAIALIELAKENYREVLRRDPAHWDARYNLERAQRLLPDPEETDPAEGEESKRAERAATTMRGYSPGLP